MKNLLILALSITSVTTFSQSITSKVLTPDLKSDSLSIQSYLKSEGNKNKELGYTEFKEIVKADSFTTKIDKIKQDLQLFLNQSNIQTKEYKEKIQLLISSLDQIRISLKYDKQNSLDKVFGIESGYLTISAGKRTNGVYGHTYEDEYVQFAIDEDTSMKNEVKSLVEKLKLKIIKKVKEIKLKDRISTEKTQKN